VSDLSLGSVRRLWRYYQAGVVNTLFGYGLFALFVKVGLNMYVAQICAHVLGAAFNYYSYSRHVFQDAEASKPRFILSYAFNYLLGLASLAAASLIIHSPYIAGIVSIVFVSLVNFFVLNNLVFFRKATQ
jgi:putative flippase GtrA